MTYVSFQFKVSAHNLESIGLKNKFISNIKPKEQFLKKIKVTSRTE